MKSDSFLTLHRQQCNWNAPRPRNVVRKDIGKIVHVISVAQLQFCKATRKLFVRKENKNNNLFNNSSSWVTVFHHFGENHDACIISVVYVQHACVFSWTLTMLITLAASESLDSWLAALWGHDFAGSIFARRHLMKLISDRLLRQRNGLMINNKIEWVLVITKWIFNYYNTDFSLEITSKVQKVSQKYTFTHKLTTKCNFQTPIFIF